jgi:hypothetical protein
MPESLLGFRLHDALQVTLAMQDSQNLHHVRIKTEEDHIEFDESVQRFGAISGRLLPFSGNRASAWPFSWNSVTTRG